MKSNVSGNRQIQIGVLLSYLAQIVSLLSGLIYTPIMLRLLGQSEYGLYQLANSVVSYLGLLNFGFSSGYLRIFFRYKVNGEDTKIAGLNGMFLVIFSVISVICLACGMIIIENVEWIFSDGLTNQELQKIKILMFVMIINLIITFLSSVFDCYLSAFEQFVFQRGIQVLKSVFNPFLTLPLLIAGYGSVAMVLVTTTLTLLGFFSSLIYCKKRLYMKFSLKNKEKGVFKEISHFTFWIFLSTIVDKINLSLDNFLLGRMCGTTIVAIYSVGGQINGFYNMISSSIATIYAPKINNVVAKSNDNNLLTNMFIDFSRFVFLILSFVLIAFIFLGQYFIRIWAGEGYDNSFYVAIILMVGCFISLLQLVGIEIQKAKNMHKFRSIIFFLIAILNIVISILLIRKFAEIGAALGTAITMILGNGVVMNYYYQYKIGLNMKKYWIEMFKLTKFLVMPIIIGICYSFLEKNIKTFIISGILMIIFYFLPIYRSYKIKKLKLF